MHAVLSHANSFVNPGSSVHGILQARIPEWVAMPPPSGDLPDPGIEPMSPASPTLAGGFLPLFHLGSPKENTAIHKRRATSRESNPAHTSIAGF